MEEKTEPEEIVIKEPLQDEVPEKEEPQEPWKISLLCSFWFIASICNTFLVRIVTDEMNIISITSALAVQLISMLSYSLIFPTLWGVPKNNTEISWLKYLKLTFPVAVSIFVRTRIKIWMIWTTPISDPVTIPVEAAYLFFALIFSKTILGNKKIDYWHMSLAAIGAWAIIYLCDQPSTLMESEILGFAVLTAFEMAFSKMIIRETNIHPVRLLSLLSGLVLLAVLPIWVWEMTWRTNYSDILDLDPQSIFLVLLFGTLSWVQSATAFTILSIVPFHHYLVGSVFNRITRFCSVALISSAFVMGYGYYRYQF